MNIEPPRCVVETTDQADCRMAHHVRYCIRHAPI